MSFKLSILADVAAAASPVQKSAAADPPLMLDIVSVRSSSLLGVSCAILTIFQFHYPGPEVLASTLAANLQVALLTHSPTIANCMEMKHTLLLLIAASHNLAGLQERRQHVWVAAFRQVADQTGPQPASIREASGHVVSEALQRAPWSLPRDDGTTLDDLNCSLKAIYQAMAAMIQHLNMELHKLAQQGIDLMQQDFEELRSEDEGEVKVAPEKTTSRLAVSKPRMGRFKIKKSSRRRTGAGRGNRTHHGAESWSVQEQIELLKLYRDRPSWTAREIVDMHNTYFWSGKEIRTLQSSRQQHNRLMGTSTRGGVETFRGKVKALEQKLESDSEMEGKQA